MSLVRNPPVRRKKPESSAKLFEYPGDSHTSVRAGSE